MKIIAKLFTALALAAIAWPLASQADQIHDLWRKSMTNDPATNYDLLQAMKPLDSNDAETLRLVTLSRIVLEYCEGSTLVPQVANEFLVQSGYYKIKGEALKEANFLASDRFKYLDFRSISHLCAGSDYMFGEKGHLVQGLITGSKGKPKADPHNDSGDFYVSMPPAK